MRLPKRVDPTGLFVGCPEQFTASRLVPKASAIPQQTSRCCQQAGSELSYTSKRADYAFTNGCAPCSGLWHVFHGPYYEHEFFSIRVTMTTRQLSYVRGSRST